jgi:hypothetical protein
MKHELIAIIVLGTIAIIQAIVIAKNSKNNRLTKIENTDKKFGANDHYWFIWVWHKDKETPLMLTDDQIADSVERALKNPEDIPE